MIFHFGKVFKIEILYIKKSIMKSSLMNLITIFKKPLQMVIHPNVLEVSWLFGVTFVINFEMDVLWL